MEGVKTGSIGEKGSFAIDGEVGRWHREDCFGILTFEKLFQSESKSRKKLKGARFVNFVL